VPKSITSQMDVVFVDHMDEVLSHALIVRRASPFSGKPTFRWRCSGKARNSDRAIN